MDEEQLEQRETEESDGGAAGDVRDVEDVLAELAETRSRLETAERERHLLARGVPEEDLDYYVYKIGKLVTEEKDFSAAAKEYLKKNPVRRGAVSVSSGGQLSGGGNRPAQSGNEIMNRIIRGA